MLCPFYYICFVRKTDIKLQKQILTIEDNELNRIILNRILSGKYQAHLSGNSYYETGTKIRLFINKSLIYIFLCAIVQITNK